MIGSLDMADLDIPPMPEGPLISIPEAPTMQIPQAPARPAIDTHVDVPAPPSLVLPDMEQLEQLTLPSFTFPQLPTFDATPPDPSGLTVPNVFINWEEPTYQSEVLDDLVAQVRSMMGGGTGLPPAVEDALFSRARERSSAETKRDIQQAVDTWAARDFSMPPGMLVKQVDVAREQARLRSAELNRDITIEAAKWEIENIRFAVTQGMALEQLNQNLHENIVKRLFEAARFQAEAHIQVFDAQVALFNAQNAAFETLAQVYRTKLDGALAHLTAYKTAVEGQAALGEINQQRVEVFKAKLDAVQSSVEVYKGLMQGAQVRADVIKSQFEMYRSEVQAFAETIAAEKVKFDAYDSRMKGEATKASVFDAQARAYAATVQAVSSQADVKVKEGQLRIEATQASIAKYMGDIEAYKAQLDAGLKAAQYSTEVFRAQMEGYKATADITVAEADLKGRYAEMATRTNIAYAEMQIASYSAQMQNSVQQAQIALESAKAVGQYSAQLAAGAMSAAHVSASISGSGSATVSGTGTESISTNHNYNY